MANDYWNRVAMAHNEQAYLTPDYDENVVCQCDRCGNDMYEGDTVYTDFDGNQVCEDCITDEIRERSHELVAPEPDWDSMPGGADDCDW